MAFSVRIFLWLFAVVFAAFPLLLAVANSPSQISKIMDVSSYAGHERDILLVCVSVLAIGLVDVLDCIASYIAPGVDVSKAGLSVAVLLTVALVVQLLAYSFWTASNPHPSLDLTILPSISLVTVLSAFSARLLLLLGGAQ